jgi:hypothetical protein
MHPTGVVLIGCPHPPGGKRFHSFSTRRRARSGGARSAAEEADLLNPSDPVLAPEEAGQFRTLTISQTAKRLRVCDPAPSKDPTRLNRPDLREHHQQVAHPRRPHARWRPGQDLQQPNLARGQVLLQPRPLRSNLVRLLQRLTTLLARYTPIPRPLLAARHAASLRRTKQQPPSGKVGNPKAVTRAAFGRALWHRRRQCSTKDPSGRRARSDGTRRVAQRSRGSCSCAISAASPCLRTML